MFMMPVVAALYPDQKQAQQVKLSREKGIAPAVYKLGSWRRISAKVQTAEDPLKFRLDIPTKQAERSFWGNAACVQMLLAHRQEYVSQVEITKMTGWDSVDAIPSPSLLLPVLNENLYGYKIPPSNQAAGYRIANLAEEMKSNPKKAKADFIARLKKNIEDGYPLIFTIHMPTMYREEYPQLFRNEQLWTVDQLSEYVLGTGYKLDEKGNIKILYFVDPFANVQDDVWGGLKYCSLDELMQAIINSSSGSYLW